MRQRYFIDDIGNYDGQEVTLEGWLAGKRSSGKILFLQLRDGTGFIQCVAGRGDVGDALFEELDALPQESSLRVTGRVVADDQRSALEGGRVGVDEHRAVVDELGAPVELTLVEGPLADDVELGRVVDGDYRHGARRHVAVEIAVIHDEVDGAIGLCGRVL